MDPANMSRRRVPFPFSFDEKRFGQQPFRPENGKASECPIAFRLKPESPALKLGFKPIPLESIGPYQNDQRVTWPIQEAEGVREHPEWLTSVDMEE